MKVSPRTSYDRQQFRLCEMYLCEMYHVRANLQHNTRMHALGSMHLTCTSGCGEFMRRSSIIGWHAEYRCKYCSPSKLALFRYIDKLHSKEQT